MNLLEHIAHHLDFEGIGTVDTDIFWGRMPDKPDDCIGVFSTDSGEPNDADRPARIQIFTRSRSVRRAYETALAIAEALHGFTGYLHGDGIYASVEALNTAAGLGADEAKRETFSSNFYVRYCG